MIEIMRKVDEGWPYIQILGKKEKTAETLSSDPMNEPWMNPQEQFFNISLSIRLNRQVTNCFVGSFTLNTERFRRVHWGDSWCY